MGEKPWFVRERGALKFRLQPYGFGGWLATAVFLAVMIGLGLFTGWNAAVRASRTLTAAMVAVQLLVTGAFVLIAWRTSVPADEVGKETRR